MLLLPALWQCETASKQAGQSSAGPKSRFFGREMRQVARTFTRLGQHLRDWPAFRMGDKWALFGRTLHVGQPFGKELQNLLWFCIQSNLKSPRSPLSTK